MDQWKLWLVHLLPLCFCFDNEVTFVTTTGRDPYVARLCTIDSWRKGTLIRCKISRERRRGDDCFVAYPPGGEDLFTICESRFTLMMVNQTVFLHLTGLTPADSGNYTCVCPFPDGKDILRLNITVEELRSRILLITVIGFACIVVSVVATGHILRKKHRRHNTRSGAPVCETPVSLDQNDPDDLDDPYTSLQQPADDLYQTISSVHRQHDNKRNSASNSIVTVHLGSI
ncbi:uncharacterized protein LOC120554124 isoform X1 [Perca fluviatilis]|uniref:uncharacterized protein LOC120554124 isoform X1 n=1 Tax=Perca fluviatilis TaxID=8168 RepID=UPI0019629663|nr:uncharacterized protein LOC120554124 isoform X1 [Perca fluviatilis]